jgi:hypothetical protein
MFYVVEVGYSKNSSGGRTMRSFIPAPLAAILITGCLLLTACGRGYEATPTPSDALAANGQTSDSGSSNVESGWQKVDYQGFQSGGATDQALVIYIDRPNQSLIFVLPIRVIIPIFNQVEIPNLPGAHLLTYKDPQNGDSLAVSVPLKYIIRGAQFGEPQKLPNGDALPYVPAGELPGFAIDFPQMKNYQIHLYIGVSVAAVFAELPKLGLPFGFLQPVKNPDKTKIVGAIGYVPPKNTFAGGMYLATQLPADLARTIDELIRW